jgi:hypothetical protein
MVVVFYLQDWNKGINDLPKGRELLPAAPQERTDQNILRFVRYYFSVYCCQSII